jgi:diguanylate cyclase (GGDEF)-like protein
MKTMPDVLARFADFEGVSFRAFQRKVLNAVLIGVAVIAATFVAADWLGLNHLGTVQLRATQIYVLFNLALLALNHDPRMYLPVATSVFVISFGLITSALLFVPGDELRVVWYFLAIAGTYILLGRVPGFLATVATIATIVVANPRLQLPFSALAVTTITLSLLSSSLFFFVFASYARTLYQRAQESRAHLLELSMYDPLTHLPNRRLLVERLQRAMVECRRNGRLGALMFLDLDRFKDVNDSLGHDAGDMLLIEVSRRLQACVREMDTVARMGGDEFIVLLPMLATEREAALRAAKIVGTKILEALNEPYQLGAHRCLSTPSIGLTVFSGAADDAQAVFKRADTAMYQAKAAGCNCVHTLLAAP